MKPTPLQIEAAQFKLENPHTPTPTHYREAIHAFDPNADCLGIYDTAAKIILAAYKAVAIERSDLVTCIMNAHEKLDTAFVIPKRDDSHRSLQSRVGSLVGHANRLHLLTQKKVYVVDTESYPPPVAMTLKTIHRVEMTVAPK